MSNLKQKVEKLERAANPPDAFPFDAIIFKVRRVVSDGVYYDEEIVVPLTDEPDTTTPGGQLPLTGSNASQNGTE